MNVYALCLTYQTILGSLSRHPNVFIFERQLLQRATRLLLACLLVAVLLGPLVIINAVRGQKQRIGVITVAAVLFVGLLSGLTKARTGEVFVAGTT